MLAGNAGKYLAVILFLVLSISLVSGFLVAELSLRTGYESTFTDFNIEDGHFELTGEMSGLLAEKLKEEELSVFPLFNKDLALTDNRTLRVYPLREEINLIALLEGAMPENDEELVLDRLFAASNGYEIGSALELGEKEFQVSGIVAFSDYSCLFENNADGMFNVSRFGVASVMQEAYDTLEDKAEHYTYAWKYHDSSLTPEEQNAFADRIFDIVKDHEMIIDFVRRSDNQAISFAGEDFGNDRVFFLAFLYITVVVLAFLYAVVMQSTIEQEAKAIGALRALGYSRAELIRHYSLLPLLATLAGALIGNVLGYTVLKDYMSDLYTDSYSLIPSPVLWNAEAFVLTTLVPVAIVLLIVFVFLQTSLSLPVQNYLRRDLSGRKQKRTVSLGKLSFMSRFRWRIIFQNAAAYLVLFVGILLGSLLMCTGLLFPPLLEHHREEVMGNQISAYQYIMRVPVETADEQAEMFAVRELNLGEASVQIFGVAGDSQFLPSVSRSLSTRKTVFSNGLADKYRLTEGDTLELGRKYTDESYCFERGDIVYYPADFAIFISLEDFREVFDLDAAYFTGYLSNHELEDLDDRFVLSIRSEKDLTLALDQLLDSMRKIFSTMAVFSAILFFVLIYILSRQVVERNQQPIAMLKILGYEHGEISSLYHLTTGLVLVFSFAISVPVCQHLLKFIFEQIMIRYIGWFEFYMAPWVYPLMVGSGLFSYLLIYIIQNRKTKGISTAEFLKRME